MSGLQPAVPTDVFGPGGLDQARRLVEEAPGQAQAFEQALSASESGGPDSLSATEDMPSATSRTSELRLDRFSEVGSNAAADATRPTPGTAEQMLRRVASDQKRLGEILGQLDSGRAFSTREMLALQSEMHQITRQLETTTKLMGEVVSGAKTIFQQQV